MAPRFKVVKGEHLQCAGPIASDDFCRASKTLFEGLQQHGCAIVQLSLSGQAALLDCRTRFGSFFSKPRSKQLNTKADASQEGTGYALLDGKELFEVVASPALAEELPRTLSDSVLQALTTLDVIGRHTLNAATSAPALGANPAAFQALLDPTPHAGISSSVLHASLYQPAPAAGAASLREHVDRGMLTIVSESEAGLEVLSGDGTWRAVELGTSSVAVIVGHTLQVASGGVLKACKHRVVPSSTAGSRRLSLAYKLRACPTAELVNSAVVLQLQQGSTGNAGNGRSVLGKRSIADVLQDFEGTHTSINQPAPQAAAGASQVRQQQQQQQEEESTQAGASAQALEDTVVVLVRDQRGGEAQFKLRQDTRVGKMMLAYAHHKQLDVDAVRFMFGGDRLWAIKTVADYGLEDGDVIDALLEQCGD